MSINLKNQEQLNENLIKAVSNDDLKSVAEFLNSGADPSVLDNYDIRNSQINNYITVATLQKKYNNISKYLDDINHHYDNISKSIENISNHPFIKPMQNFTVLDRIKNIKNKFSFNKTEKPSKPKNQ